MSLYLAIFDGASEIDGWVLGHYSDFASFREAVARHFSAQRLPLLLSHSDCDGDWRSSDLPYLRDELLAVASRFRQLPPEPIVGAFEHTAHLRVDARCLADCFHNVDGENLLEALLSLVDRADQLGLPILFQ
jgi:hypothetical protein